MDVVPSVSEAMLFIEELEQRSGTSGDWEWAVSVLMAHWPLMNRGQADFLLQEIGWA
jgi:hypothetical protein